VCILKKIEYAPNFFLEKALKVLPYLNRYRYFNRVYLGVWVNSIEGTRQNNPVTSGEGVPKISKTIERCNRIGGGDCLLKTQDSAKL